MVTQVIICYHCDSENIVKNGKAPNGKQKYLCHDCARQSRESPGSNAYTPQRREEILSAYQERSSLRGLARTFGVSRNESLCVVIRAVSDSTGTIGSPNPWCQWSRSILLGEFHIVAGEGAKYSLA